MPPTRDDMNAYHLALHRSVHMVLELTGRFAILPKGEIGRTPVLLNNNRELERSLAVMTEALFLASCLYLREGKTDEAIATLGRIETEAKTLYDVISAATLDGDRLRIYARR